MSFLSNTQKSTILVTGGASGIGLALSVKLSALGHTVIVAGRRQTQLDEAQKANPKLKTIQGDIGSDAGRIALFQNATRQFPDLNVLVNNAGILGAGGPLKDSTPAEWETYKSVIETNFVGAIHLTTLFLPHLVSKSNALVVNNTSILAFFPVAGVPIYAATKAALHSFTISLRHQLKDTSVKVVEIAPPAVETDATRGGGFPQIQPDEYAVDTIRQLLEGKSEITFNNDSPKTARASRDELDALFNLYNGVV
eukprot:gene33109-40858_t